MTEPIRVLVVDDHELFRQGVTGVLSGRPEIEVVGEATDGDEALDRARELMPDVILMDIHMPGVDGLEATRRIKQELPYVRIVMLTVSDEDEMLFKAIKAGASGYLLKNVPGRQLADLVVEASRGEATISGSLAFKILEELTGAAGGERREEPAGAAPGPAAGARPRPPVRRTGDVEALTPREAEVLELVSRGLTNREIGERLYISVYTVKNHLRNILEKLHLKNRAEAAAFAVKEGLVDVD